MTAIPAPILADADARPAWCADYPPGTHPHFYREDGAPRDLEMDSDGFVFDAGTGEVLDQVDDDKETLTSEPFRPTDRAGAEWVLRRIATAEADVAAVRNRRRVLLENLDKQERRGLARLDWLHRRFDADLEAFARELLKGGKGRTLQLDHGRISFRESKGTNKITDPEAAVAFVKASPLRDQVKVVESVAATTVAAALEARLEDARRIAGLRLANGLTRPELAETELERRLDDIRERAARCLEQSGPRTKVTIGAGILEG